MKVTRNPNGSILLEPENDDEKEGLEYEFSRRGNTYLKEILEKHVNQRKSQKVYEQVMDLHTSMQDLSEADRNDVIATTKANIGKKPKKNAK
jgi:hypothetical protein